MYFLQYNYYTDVLQNAIEIVAYNNSYFTER